MQSTTLPLQLPVPALLLQPLVENAVYHGVQPLPQGGTVPLRGRRTGSGVEIVIAQSAPARGTAIAGAQWHGAGQHAQPDRVPFRLAWRAVGAGRRRGFPVTLRLPDGEPAKP